jgi:hypothetical protein
MDPRFKQVFKEVADDYSKAIVQNLDTAQPAIDRVTDKAEDMLNKVGDRAGTMISNSLVNLVKAVIAEIPLVGGVITGIISLGDLANKAMRTCAPPINFATEVGLPMVNKAADKVQNMQCELIKIQDRITQAMDKLPPSGKDKDKTKDQASTQEGGGSSASPSPSPYSRIEQRIAKSLQTRLRYNYNIIPEPQMAVSALYVPTLKRQKSNKKTKHIRVHHKRTKVSRRLK